MIWKESFETPTTRFKYSTKIHVDKLDIIYILVQMYLPDV